MDSVRTAIEKSNAPLIAGHINPDADCISTLIVMTSVLCGLGKQAKLVLPIKSVSRKFGFLLDVIPKITPADLSELNSAHCDLIIVLDTALRSRINLPKEFSLPDEPICNIDHHLGNELFGRYNWVDSQARSTAQMIYLLLESMGISLSSEQASLLYAGLHCDTCGFSLYGTDEQALTVAAKLAHAGANIGWVCQKLYRSLAVSEFKLMQTIYKNTNISECGRFAWSSITLDEFDSIGASPADIDEQVSIPRSIDEVKIAALFSEVAPGRIRINLRANDEVNLLPLAKSLGGGGHAQAAGIITTGEMDEVIERVKSAVIEYLNNSQTVVI